MAIIKTYQIAKCTKTGKGDNQINFITGHEKVSETVFYELLDAKIKELLGEKRMDLYDDVISNVNDALDCKNPVTILDRTFEVKFKRTKD
ncbi:hypothetical protein [Flavobacterium koreense]